ncbi:MAG TPA: TlpA disulfide reductase family protein [Steroidobacteraceae bacterium]|jgi:peroxiredoxin|nr:TlpA disulfide reductase family protein [Steroidobacteraceae bacterium]
MRSARILIPALLLALLGGTATATGPAPPAPDFTLPARDGGEVRLSELKGQVVMINFWATWCGPCRQEMPLLQQIHAKYEPLGFTMLGVNVEPDSAAAQNWLKDMPVSFPIVFDRKSEVSSSFGVEAMPSSVLIDREGRVRHVHRGYKPGDEAVYADLVRGLVKE